MTIESLKLKNDELNRRLQEAEETLLAIRDGTVDAFVGSKSAENRVYTLDGADRPYRLLVEKMQQGAATLHGNGTIAYANLRLAELLEMPHEKLIGAALSKFISAADRALFDNLLSQAQVQPGQGEVSLKRMDGAWVPVLLTFNALPKDCGAAIGVLITDLTSQKHQEDLAATHRALQVSEARLHVTLESIGDAIIATDGQGLITTLNPVAEELTGWKSNEAIGRPLLEIFKIVHEKTREAVLDPMTKVLADGLIGGLGDNVILIHKSGGECAIDDSVAPIRDEAGTIIGVVLVFRDITERRKTESALKEADRHKNEFLAMLAHELRNPLAPIRTAAQVMRIKKQDPEVIQSAAGMIERQIAQMVRLVDDLLDVSRITRGTIELRKERLNLVSIVHHAAESARTTFQVMGHHLTLTLPAEPVYLHADPARLAQAIGNLLNNASKFTDRGGRIGLKVEVEPSVDGTGEPLAALHVTDNGIGIAADQLPRIFEMFTQLDTSLERSRGGLGIGLTLVRSLMELHGGSVSVHSEGVGKGSEFTLRVPLAQELPPALSASPPHAAPSPVPRRILVVDDNRDAAEMFAMLLDLNGNTIQIAHDGLEALAAAKAFRPDVVILDIGLPKLNGYEVARQIRAESWGGDMVLVALTGWGQDEDRKRSNDAGFNAHLVKPVEIDELMKLLADIGTQK